MSAKQKSSKHLLIYCLVFLLLASYIIYALAEPLNTYQPKTTFQLLASSQKVILKWPSYGEAAVGAVGDNILATNGPQSPLPTASTIKVLTALCILDVKPLSLNQDGPTITISQADIDSYDKYLVEGGSVVRVVLGEQLNEFQALEALLIPSANNMAETLARWAFGSIDNFNSFANNYARQLGLTNTTVTDPSGFLATTLSTPSDLTLLGEAVINNAVISNIVSQIAVSLPGQGLVHNTNVLLNQNNVIGIKTGNNDQDRGCFLFATKQIIGNQPITVIGAIMNAPSLGTVMSDALPLISSLFNSFSSQNITTANQKIAIYQTAWHQSANVVAADNLTTTNWKESDNYISINLSELRVPVKAGTRVGTMTVRNSISSNSYSVPLVLDQAIKLPSWYWRLTHPQ